MNTTRYKSRIDFSKVNVRFTATPKAEKVKGVSRYQFAEMEVGDAMAVKFPVPYSCASAAASDFAKRHGVKFKRAIIDGVRVIIRVA